MVEAAGLMDMTADIGLLHIMEAAGLVDTAVDMVLRHNMQVEVTAPLYRPHGLYHSMEAAGLVDTVADMVRHRSMGVEAGRLLRTNRGPVQGMPVGLLAPPPEFISRSGTAL